MSFLREVKDFIRYKRLPIKNKLIFVYSEHSGYAINFMPTLNVLMDKYGINICYVTSEPSDPIFQLKKPKLTVLYSKKLLLWLMASINSPICIMTMPDLNTYHIKRSAHKVHYVYLFHSMLSTHMIYRFGAFDHFDTVLCTGSYQIDEIRKAEELYKLKPKRLVEAGYTRLDDVYQEYTAYPAKVGRQKILLAPGWGASNILETSGIMIIDSLVAEGYDVKLRYHPETVKRRADIVEKFDKYYLGTNVEIEKSVADNKSFMEADLLITDWSGVSLEYAFGTERPVVYINTERKVMNHRYEELGIEPFEVFVREQIGKVVELEDVAGIASVVNNMLKQRGHYVDNIRQLRGKYVFNFKNAKDANASAIVDILKARA